MSRIISSTAVLIRKLLGAVPLFEKASLVAKPKGGRDRKKAQPGKCEGRKSILEHDLRIVAAAKAQRAMIAS
jgi:hypothetical protein